jgi:hypothetical protein
VREGQLGRVEELALEAEIVAHAVRAVARDGQLDRSEVHADLVRAAGLESDLEQRMLAEELQQLEMRHSLARRRRVERLSRRVEAIAADGRLDATAARAWTAANQGEIDALDSPTADQALQATVRLVGTSDHEQARGVPVEPVDDARPARLVPSGEGAEQPVDERSTRMAGAGVNDHAGRLVDYQQVLVREGDPQVELLGLDRRRCGCQLELDLFPAPQPVALRTRVAVDADETAREQAIRSRAGANLRQLGQETVEPAAGRAARNAVPQPQRERDGGAARGRRRKARRAGRRHRRR